MTLYKIKKIKEINRYLFRKRAIKLNYELIVIQCLAVIKKYVYSLVMLFIVYEIGVAVQYPYFLIGR